MGSTNEIRVKRKSDGGFWAALASFILLLGFLFVRSDIGKSYFGDHGGLKFTLAVMVFIISCYASHRRIRHPDYSNGFFGRPYATQVMIWFAWIFSVPSIIIYGFLLFSK